MIRILISFAWLFVLSACAVNPENISSIEAAGVTTVDTKPVIISEGESLAGTEYHIAFGKEYGSVKVHVQFAESGRPLSVMVDASEVAAFAGQAQAAQAVVEIERLLAEQNIALSQAGLAAVKRAITLVTGFPVP